MTWPRAEPSSQSMSCTKLTAPYERIPDTHCTAYRHIRLEWSSFHGGLDRDCADHALSPSHRREWCPASGRPKRCGTGRQRDLPDLAVRGHDLHGAVRAGELDSLGDRAGHGGDSIDISAQP